MDSLIGTILGEKYRIERLLGSGGMGAVYEGADVGSGDRVAIKLIQTKIPVDSKDLVARFEREARAAGAIDTEHIARCVGAGTDAATGQPFMVLEYLEGEDLQRVLRRTGPLDPQVALRIVAQACLGLAHAHEASVVHRDIKPANLFLAKRKDTDELVVKILDFGVAKILTDPGEDSAHGDGLTRTGSLLGSPLYMSPEQARSVKKVDGRADLWSLGVVLYKALAGRTPYDHITAIGDMILALWSEPPTPVQQFAPWVPAEIAAILDRMLQVEPNDRFQTAREILAALGPLLPERSAIREPEIAPISAEVRERPAPLYFRRFDTKRGFERAVTAQPPSRVVTAEPPSRAITAEPPSRAITAQPPSRVGFYDDSPPRQGPEGTIASRGHEGALPSDSGVSGTSSPGGQTQNGLTATGDDTRAAAAEQATSSAPSRGKAIGVAVVGLAIGVVVAGVFFAKGSPSAPITPSAPTTVPSASIEAPPAVTPAQEPTTAATAIATAPAPSAQPSTTAAPTSTATASAVRPNAVPTARPKASSSASTSGKFTDFGDRK